MANDSGGFQPGRSRFFQAEKLVRVRAAVGES